MLSVEQRKFDQLYAYRAGMANVAFVAGVARFVKAREGYIQQSNNLNQMIHFLMEEGDTIPHWVRDGVNVKVVARMQGARNGDEPVVTLKALAFEPPSIYDMPPRQAWERDVREGVPTDEVKPSEFRPEDQGEEERPTMGGLRVSDTGNMVRVAGFVSSFFVEPAGVPKAEGGVTQGCLVLTLRQTNNKDDLIPVRCYGPKAESLARRLEVGVPLLVKGKVRVRLKNTGEPAGEGGILPVHKYPYVHVSNLGVANRSDIREEPAWAKEMVLEHRSKRQSSKAPAQTEVGVAAPSAQPGTASAEQPLNQNSAPPQQQVMDADVALDPAVLKMLGTDSTAA